jgi:PAS domain S-box-containing protein
MLSCRAARIAAAAVVLVLVMVSVAVAWPPRPRPRPRPAPAIPPSDLRFYHLTHYLFNHLDQPVVFCALDGRVVAANKAYQRMLGYSLAELKQKTYQELTPVRWHAMERRLRNQRVMRRGWCEEYEKEYIRKDGKVIRVRGRAWLVRDRDGRPQWLLGIYRQLGPARAAKP